MRSNDYLFKWVDSLDSTSDKTLGRFLEKLGEKTIMAYGRWSVEDHRIRSSVIASKARSDPKEKSLVVWVNDSIIAYAHITMYPKLSRRFQGTLGFVVSEIYQNKGLGTLLMKEVLKKAEAMGLRKVWAHVHHDNPRMLRLYFQHGFVIEGFFKDDEHYGDKVISTFSVAKFL